MINHVNVGIYTVQEGDTPQSVAKLVYNDVRLYTSLLKDNPESAWSAGMQIEVRNKQGRTTEVRPEEDVIDIIRRMYSNQPVHLYIDRFYEWNGGKGYAPEAGDIVYVPER